jgi:hypothetical protein
MIGLSYILFFWLYFLLSRIVVRTFAETAKKFHRNGRLWGFIGGFIMYNVLFFDLIPVNVVHYYKCETEGGLTVYKTIEEWKRENPGVAETLNSNPQASQSQYEYSVENEHSHRFYRLPDGTELVADNGYYDGTIYTDMKRKDGSIAHWLNQRFAHESNSSMVWYIVRKKEERIVDLKTHEVIAQSVDFDTTGPTNPVELGGAKSWRDYVSGTKIRNCYRSHSRNKWLVNSDAISSLEDKITHLNGEKNEH